MDGIGRNDLLTDSDHQMSEYANQLRNWIQLAYHHYVWYTCQCIPFLSLPPLNSQPMLSNSANPRNTNPTLQEQRVLPPVRAGGNLPNQPNINVAGANQQQAGRIHDIPRLSKRLLAEIIDFGLLFFIKALITLAVLDSWNLEETETLLENGETEDGDYELAMAITANLLTIEFVHRILVIFYEVWFTHTQGGTPGKRTMGIRILSCTKCLPIGENRLLVFPATEISVWRSIGRAFFKNMGTALLFPTFLPLMIVQHNRTLYDIFCGTIVVESD